MVLLINIQTRLKEECLTEFQTLMLDKLIATFKKMGKSKPNYPISIIKAVTL